MRSPDQITAAINAAGIAEALTVIRDTSDSSFARWSQLSEKLSGSVGIMESVAAAGLLMEQFRVRSGVTASWGNELPYLYDVWDEIAKKLWQQLSSQPLVDIVENAIKSVIANDIARSPS